MVDRVPIPPDLDPVIADLLRRKDPVRRQHFVPVFYLDYFSGSDGLLTVLKRNERRILKRPYSPRACACAPFFYANWEGKNDLLAQIAELIFEDLEGQFGRLIPPILERMRGSGPLDLSDKHTLSDFMCLLWMRNPQWRNWVKSSYAEMAQMTMKLTAHVKGEAIFDEHPDIFKDMTADQKAKSLALMKSDAKIEVGNQLPFQLFIEMFPKWRRMFGALKWKVYVNKTEKPFVTSDNPTSVVDRSEHPPFPGTLFERKHYLALAPDLMIEAYGSGRDSKPIQRHTILSPDDPLIVSLNSSICFCASTWAYAPSREPFDDLLAEIARREAIIGPLDADGGAGPVHALRPERFRVRPR